MEKILLETNSLIKDYKGVRVLDNVNIKLGKGKIYGLIGKNGAGKTTLMRMIAGLGFPTSGSITMFGHSDRQNLEKERSRIGFMIEYPSINSSMTAKENILLHRTIKGIPNEEIEDELLSLVGLDNVKNKKVRNYSLGMKQRLGIAIALVGSPELLILDEPINGLDPIGLVDIRNLLHRLCEKNGITILLSSHNLAELYQVATDYIFIDNDKIVKEITLEELEEKFKKYICIQTDEPERLVAAFEREFKDGNYYVMPDKSIRIFDLLDYKEDIAKLFQRENILITNFSEEGDTLENYFLKLIGGDKND